MESPDKIKFAHFDQSDATPATFTQSPAAVSQPSPSFIHIPQGVVPQETGASLSYGYCQLSPAQAALLLHRKIIQIC